jgi:SAM-dependent methyltransferase
MNVRVNPSAVRTDPADAVQTFYDDHPYPPPVADLDRYREAWSDPNRLRVEYHLMWPKAAYRDDLEILIAGCGTSQAAKHALRQPAARVAGIDSSATSLRHTRELKRRYGLKNLEVRQLPIERVHELGRQFDKIVCTGVLHHLADPDAGLRDLRAVLKPDGAMYLMVYATYGRSGIYMIQEYCRQLGVGTSKREIEDLIAVLRTLPNGHPLAPVLREAPDMRRPDALADALLHPRDRAYTVPQLFDFVERNGCKFGRWYRQAQYVPQCGALAASPHAARLTGETDESPRKFFFYTNDDGGITAIRINDWKVVFMEQRAKGMLLWAEPFVELRIPKIFNLRRDPFERADESSNTYWDWWFDHIPAMYVAQALAAEQIQSFKEFPPRQEPAAFNLDRVLEKMQEATDGSLH